MANYPYSHGAYGTYTYADGNIPPSLTHARAPVPRRMSTQREIKRVDEADLVLGRVFWLPPKEELPPKAVRRAHGKGAVEEGIYNHPVVVVSRPSEEPHVVHFHVITSFQGKRLHEIYSKDNEFHASRRSWYLSISPSPCHPDATSKKMQKRFPTLDLKDGATLRWDSYVNIRHVYKIDWSLLKPYSNPDTPEIQTFRLDRESCDKMLAKTKLLTNYEPGTQYQVRSVAPRRYTMGRSATSPLPLSIPLYTERDALVNSPRSASEDGSIGGSEYSGFSPILQSDFGEARINDETEIPVPKKRPPDGVLWKIWWIVMWCFKWPWGILKKTRERFRGRVRE